MSRPPSGNPTPTGGVRAMFDAIAPRYDFMNTLMTAGLDAGWRRATIDACALRPGMRVLDVATGTGLLARAAAARVGPGGGVIGVDVSSAMLEVAHGRVPRSGSAGIGWQVADAMQLPFEAATFDATLVGFGLRNLPDYAAAVREMARVTRPRGRVAILEIARPRAPVPRLVHATWFTRVVPLMGRLAGGGAAYSYLPESLDTYPTPEEVGRLMADAGLTDIRWRWLRGGMTTLHLAQVAEASR